MILVAISGCSSGDACDEAEQEARDNCEDSGSHWSPQNCRVTSHDTNLFTETCKVQCDCVYSSSSVRNIDEDSVKKTFKTTGTWENETN